MRAHLLCLTSGECQVRLAKEKKTSKLYAVKIMNKDFLKKKQVSGPCVLNRGSALSQGSRAIAVFSSTRSSFIRNLASVIKLLGSEDAANVFRSRQSKFPHPYTLSTLFSNLIGTRIFFL